MAVIAMVGGTAEVEALRAIKQRIDIKAVAAAFGDSFLLISVAFLFASMPMLWISMRRLGVTHLGQKRPA